MILGIDVSTSITGFSVIDGNGQLVYFSNVDLRKHKDFFKKAIVTKEHILDLYEKYDVTSVYIEKPFEFFNSGGSTAATMAKLQKFNGVVSWICFEVFEVIPDYLTANQARKLVGIKVPRGQKAKKVVRSTYLKMNQTFKSNGQEMVILSRVTLIWLMQLWSARLASKAKRNRLTRQGEPDTLRAWTKPAPQTY